MANRTRPIRIEFCVSDYEHRLIKNKMAQLSTRNMGAYLRKMAIDGYIIKVDHTEQKKLAVAVSRAAANINHICRCINQTGHFSAEDVADLKARQAEIWQLLKQTQKDELPPQAHRVWIYRHRVFRRRISKLSRAFYDWISGWRFP